MTIGEKIAKLRKEKHITQTELAEYLFLVPQTISKWEVGNGTPEISLLPKIASFFDVSYGSPGARYRFLWGLTDLYKEKQTDEKIFGGKGAAVFPAGGIAG